MYINPQLWTVGFYRPDGKWEAESDHDSETKAAGRAHWLNGAGAELFAELLAACKLGVTMCRCVEAKKNGHGLGCYVELMKLAIAKAEGA